jgi:hypothetical protein
MKPEKKTRLAIAAIIAPGILIHVSYAINGNLPGTAAERLFSLALLFFMLLGFTAGLFLPAGKMPRWLLIIPLLILFLLCHSTLFYEKSFLQQWDGVALWLAYPLCGIAVASLWHVWKRKTVALAGGMIGYLAGAGITFLVSLCMEGINTENKMTLILQFLSASIIFLVCYGLSAGTGKEEEEEDSGDAGISRREKIIFGLFIAIQLLFMFAACLVPYYPNIHFMLVLALCVTDYVFLVTNRQPGYRFVQASLLSMIIALSVGLLEQWLAPFVVKYDAVFPRSFILWAIPLCAIQLTVVYLFAVRNRLKALSKHVGNFPKMLLWIAGLAAIAYVGGKYYREPDRTLVNDAVRVKQIAMSDAIDFLENRELFPEYEPTEPADDAAFEKNTQDLRFYNKEGFTLYPETYAVKIVSESLLPGDKPEYISCKARVFSKITNESMQWGICTGLILSEPVTNKASAAGVMSKMYAMQRDDRITLTGICLLLGFLWTAIVGIRLIPSRNPFSRRK